MADLTYETVRISAEGITPDLLVWRRYKRRAPGMLEALLDANPAVTAAMAQGPLIPLGTVVRIPIDADILAGTPASQKVVRLYGEP